jgi:SAM-dependent methyltransferase
MLSNSPLIKQDSFKTMRLHHLLYQPTTVRYVLLLTIVGLFACESRSQSSTNKAFDTSYTYRTGSRDGIGKWYMGREIAVVMGHQGADWLEREEREVEERPSKVLESLTNISPSSVIADIGAGTGYYSFRLAKLVPQGKVMAVDIQPEMLAIIAEKARREKVPQVITVQGTETDPNLPAASVDIALLVDVYHEFNFPKEMMRGLVRSLKKGGRIILLEFKAEDPNVPIKTLHKMSVVQARLEIEAAGLRFIENRRILPWQHYLIFEKP